LVRAHRLESGAESCFQLSKRRNPERNLSGRVDHSHDQRCVITVIAQFLFLLQPHHSVWYPLLTSHVDDMKPAPATNGFAGSWGPFNRACSSANGGPEPWSGNG